MNEAVNANKEKELKAFFIFLDDSGKAIEPKLSKLADDTKSHDLALAYLPTKHEAIDAYKVNVVPEVKNTVLLYRNKQVTAKFVNLVADEKGLTELKAALAKLVE